VENGLVLGLKARVRIAQGSTLVVLQKSWLTFEPGFLLDGAMDDSS